MGYEYNIRMKHVEHIGDIVHVNHVCSFPILINK